MNYLSASIAEVNSLLRKGALNATHLTELSLQCQKHINKLNAFITSTGEYALKKARVSQSRLLKQKSRGSLEGIPIAVKDNFCTKGIRTSCGSKILRNYVPPYTATVVQRLEDAGAVMVGKTNLDEFAMGSGSVDSAFGPVKNIYKSGINYTLGGKEIREDDLRHSIDEDWVVCGGSSGGSAVAVACGAAFAGLGSDTGGSVRVPASFCGIVGFKPSYGVLPRHGLVSMVNSLDAPGIFGRTVDDVTHVFRTIAGVDHNDSTSENFTFKEPKEISLKGLKGMVIGIPRECHCEGLDDEVLQTWTSISKLLQDAGAEVREVSLPHTPYAYSCYFVLTPCEVASNFTRFNGLEYGEQILDTISMEGTFALTRAAGLNEVVRGRILAGNYFLLNKNIDKYYRKALKTRRLIQEDYNKAWDSGIQLLLTPTTATTAPRFSTFKHEDLATESSIQDLCTSANMAGVCALSIPISHSSNNLPISLQLTAPQNEDLSLLSVAKWLEKTVKFKRLQLLI